MPGRKVAEGTRREQILKAAHAVALSRGIDGLTVRAVAARGRLSHSLVFFHFKRKDQLGLALLDRVLAMAMPPVVPDDVGQIPEARERLAALIRRELHRVSAEPQHVRLLLEYWARGAHNATIRKQILAGLEGYREGFRALAQEAVPSRADGVAAAAVSLILGYPVQAMIDPDHLDLEEYLASADDILGRQASAPPAPPARTAAGSR